MQDDRKAGSKEAMGDSRAHIADTTDQHAPSLTVTGHRVGGRKSIAASLGCQERRWRSVGLFLVGAVPCSIVGSLSVIVLPATVVIRSMLTNRRLGRGHVF